MAADASIFNALMQPRKSALDYANEFEQQGFQREQMGMQRQQNALAIETAKRNNAREEAASALQGRIRSEIAALGDGVTDDQLAGVYLRNGVVDQYMKIRDSAADIEGKRVKNQGQATANDSAKWEQKQKERNQAVLDIVNFSTPQEAVANITQRVQAGLLPPEVGQGLIGSIQQSGGNFDAWRVKVIRGMMSAPEQVKAIQTDTQLAQQDRHNRATEGLTARGQNMTDARARENLGVSRDRLALDRSKTAEKQNPQTARVADATDALQLIDQAEKLIDGATGSYVGAGIDQIARVFGASTEGAENAAQLKAVEGILVSKMPKMSGPQSDKDVLLYRQMAGQIGDPTIPAATKKAALKTIRQIQERYAGGGITAAPAAQAQPAKVVDFGSLR